MHTEKRLCQHYAGTAFFVAKNRVNFCCWEVCTSKTEFALLFVFCFTYSFRISHGLDRCGVGNRSGLPDLSSCAAPALGAGVVQRGRKTFPEETTMTKEPAIALSKAEKQLIELIRSLDYGEIRVMIKDKHPIRVEEIRRSIQLPIEK